MSSCLVEKLLFCKGFSTDQAADLLTFTIEALKSVVGGGGGSLPHFILSTLSFLLFNLSTLSFNLFNLLRTAEAYGVGGLRPTEHKVRTLTDGAA